MAAGAPVPVCTFQSLASLLYVNDGYMWWFQNIWSSRLGSIFSFWAKGLIMSCPIFFFLCPAPFICYSVQCHRLLILFPEWLRRWNHHITLWWVRQTLPCSPMKVFTWASKGRAQRLDWDLIKKERRLTEGIKLCTWLCFMLFLCYYMFLSATEATPLFSAPYWNTLYERVATKALLLHQWWIMS